MNTSLVNRLDTAFIIGEKTLKTSKEVFKITRILVTIAFHLLHILLIVSSDLADQQVQVALREEPKLLMPVKAPKLLMPAPEHKETLVEVADLEDLEVEELRIIAQKLKVKGWNFIQKKETMLEKIHAKM